MTTRDRGYGICTALLFAVTCPAQSTARFYFAYADAITVELAHSSGLDPEASIGREIPQGHALQVPSSTFSGGHFKVQLWQEYSSGNSPWVKVLGVSSNLAFDRTFCGEGGIDPPLDDSSFRKLTYGGATPFASYSNFQSYLAFSNTGEVRDRNGDGIQDNVRLWSPRGETRGSFGPGESIRPLGLSSNHFGLNQANGVSLDYWHIALNDKQHLFDVEFRTEMVAGETYGFGAGETGLSIVTNPNLPPGGDVGNSTWFSPHSGFGFTGAKYNLLAVPEPSSLLALGLGLIALRKRRKFD